jgi:hypothetical protein
VATHAYPAVQVFNGSIHAGAGLCNVESVALAGPGSTVAVTGNPNSNSFGQYVVSASKPATSINNFGSAGVASNTTLNLGTAGAYAQACRPDLLTAALTYRTNGGANVQTIVSTGAVTTVNIGAMRGVYYFDGGQELDISGTVNGSVTIIKTAAAGVVKMGTITRSNALFASHAVPSLGVITAGDIVIPAAVLNVDAYLFANGTVDTCLEGEVVATRGACSTQMLTINGFMMAHNIFFRRLGPFATQGAITSEQVVLSPQIYLNPPKFFDFTVDGNFADGQGEKQPLF